MAREAVDPGAELQPALPVAHADRRAAAGLRRELGLDAGDRGMAGRRALVGAPGVRRRIPVGRPAELVRPPRRRLQLAALGVDGAALHERRRDGSGRDRPRSPSRVRTAARPRSAVESPGPPSSSDDPPPRTAVRGAASGIVAEPGERAWRRRVVRRLRLPPGRDLADERDPLLQPAHPVDEALRLGLLGRERLGRRPVAHASEELGEPAVGLEVAPDHDRVVRLERLGDPVDQRAREPERVAHLADRGPRPVRDEVADHPGVVGSVAPVDVLDDLLPALRAEVDVDVRVGRPARVDEPLEQQVVGDRLDPADPERVRHDRAGRAAPALGRDPLLLREAHEVPADEEELGEAGPLDHVELVREPGHDRRGHRVVAAARARPAQLREVGERGLPVRDGEAREAVLLEPEVDRARRRELDRGGDPLRPGPRGPRVVAGAATRRQPGQLLPGLQDDSPSGRRSGPSVSSVRPWRIAVSTSASSRSSRRA